MDVTTSAGRSLGREHFGAAELGDARRTRRLVKSADAILRHPGGTLPQKLRTWADLSGLYRLVRAEAVTHEAVLAPHRRLTLGRMAERARGGEVVLLLHDWTELDYTSRTSLKHLGQIGNGGGRGYVCHNTLAVTAGGEVIGLASQVLHRRRHVPEGETPRQKRDHPGRESRLWVGGCETAGPAPRGALWVDVADRGADAIEFLEYQVSRGRHFVIRAAKDRNLEGEDHVGSDRVHRKLLAYARDLAELGRRRVEVPRQQAGKRRRARATREAEVRVAAGPLTLRASRFGRGQCRGLTLELWVVHVSEVDPPPGAQPLEWVLLTDLPADTLARACERVDWYGCRPLVEEYHKAMKTGCGIEDLQFEDERRLEPVIALLSVVSVVLLQLRHVARRQDADRTAAATIVPTPFVRVLSAWRYGRTRDDLSVREFCFALARLGGHLNRKGDGFPGWLTLWRGWADLQLMVQGAEALRRNRCV